MDLSNRCIFVNLKNQKLKIEIYSINIKSFLAERINIPFQNFIEPILNSLVYKQGYQQIYSVLFFIFKFAAAILLSHQFISFQKTAYSFLNICIQRVKGMLLFLW